MAIAANGAAISSSADDSTYNVIDGLNDATFSRMADLLDVTDFADTSGTKLRIYGLKDASFSLSGDLEAADTGYGRIETAYGDGSTVYIKYLPNGTTGWKAACKVESIEVSGSVDGKAEVSVSLQATGVVTAV